MLVNYYSNNSGGEFWLADEDWEALEKAGWIVNWHDKRRFGTPAYEAEKEFNTIKEAIDEFEKITNQEASAEGCECCGPPHEFTWEDEKGIHTISGKEIYYKFGEY